MRSYHLDGNGYALRHHDVPAPGPREVLVRVRAASFNRRDDLILTGRYPLPARPGVVPLSDGAGEVAAVDAEVTRFAPGDRVVGSYWNRWWEGRLAPDLIDQLGCTSDGMLTEYAVLDERAAARVPAHLTWAEAATLPCAGVTAWTSLTGGTPLEPGATVLTLGTGGLSLFAVQLGAALGLRVIVTTSSDARAARAKEIGAEAAVNYVDGPEWSKAVLDLTGGRGADLVVETRGPDTIEESMRAASLYGQVVLLITQSETRPDVTVSGATWARTMAGVRRGFVGSRADLEDLGAFVERHRIRPVVDRVFAFDEAEEALRYYREGTALGKVGVDVG